MSKFKILLAVVGASGLILSLIQTILSIMDKDWMVMLASILAFAIFLIGTWVMYEGTD